MPAGTQDPLLTYAWRKIWDLAERGVFLQTVVQSARLLYMLLFFATLALLINSSVLYYLERGTYSNGAQVSIPQLLFVAVSEVLHPAKWVLEFE